MTAKKESIYSGQQLRRHRRFADWTQEDLAQESGISSKTISRYEREGFSSTVTKREIQALADALRIEPARLEKPTLQKIRDLGLAAAEDMLLDPNTEDRHVVLLVNHIEKLRAEQQDDDTEQKDLTQIFNITPLASISEEVPDKDNNVT